jgi:hypothetical protein
MKSNSIWSKLDRFPPILVRLLAKHSNGTAMTDAQITENSGLWLSDVKRLSFLTTWNEVAVWDMQAFVKACGVDFANREQMRNANRYITKDPKFSHLRRDKNFPAFKEMLLVYLQSQTE